MELRRKLFARQLLTDRLALQMGLRRKLFARQLLTDRRHRKILIENYTELAQFYSMLHWLHQASLQVSGFNIRRLYYTMTREQNVVATRS